MTAAVRIMTAERVHALRVPDQALRFTPGGVAHAAKDSAARAQAAVWRLQSGKPVRVPVVAGLDDDVYTEILGGTLSEGDAIIVGEGGAGTAAGTPRVPRL
jgi:HlyD family secretion protein